MEYIHSLILIQAMYPKGMGKGAQKMHTSAVIVTTA